MQSHGIRTVRKPTTKNLNSKLLEFVQGSGILEADFSIPSVDKQQVIMLYVVPASVFDKAMAVI